MKLDIEVVKAENGDYCFGRVSEKVDLFFSDLVMWHDWKARIYPDGKIKCSSHLGEGEYLYYTIYPNGDEVLKRKCAGQTATVLRNGSLKRSSKEYWAPLGVIRLIDGDDMWERTARFIRKPVYELMAKKGISKIITQNPNRMYYLKVNKRHLRALKTDGEVQIVCSSHTSRHDFKKVRVRNATWVALVKEEMNYSEVKFFTLSDWPEYLQGLPDKFEI